MKRVLLALLVIALGAGTYFGVARWRVRRANEALQRAAAGASRGDVAAAEREMSAVDARLVDAKRYAALTHAIEQRKANDVPLVFDRKGGAIASLRSGQLVTLNPDFAPLVDANAGALTIGAQLPRIGSASTIETTLDPFVQRAALAALGQRRGSLVAIDPKTNEIVAIASNGGGNAALERQFEPGSVIKVLTGLNALANGVDVQSMFPYTCKGELMIDGRHFGDWMPSGHGRLDSIDDALAVSCNVFFADVGLRLGREKLQHFMRAAGFDGQTSLGYANVPLGKSVGAPAPNFETAFYAIGLAHESIDAIHLAMLASMMANRGVLTTPRFLIARRNVLGEDAYHPPAQGATRLAPAAAAETMIHAMQAVASSPRGTGRRATVDGVTLAMKTGTAGERKGGLDALIMAFAPAEAPRIAFGIIAEDAGPAEFAGAEIAHEFLERMKASWLPAAGAPLLPASPSASPSAAPGTR